MINNRVINYKLANSLRLLSFLLTLNINNLPKDKNNNKNKKNPSDVRCQMRKKDRKTIFF